MKLPDRSPGLTIIAAAVFVYGTILVEIGMWMAASWILMFATLAFVIAVALGIVRWFNGLIADDEGVVGHAALAEVPAAPVAPVARPVAPKAPRVALPA